MSLLDLIRKPVLRTAATATPAIPAIPTAHADAHVARIASLAVANSAGASPINRATPAIQSQPSLALPNAYTDPATLIFAYAQRMAICSESGDVAEDQAQRIATEECGAELEDLITCQIAYWRHCIEALPEPTDRRLAAIKTTCLEGLAQRWVHDAARFGWDECAIFGLDAAAPTIHDRNGLLPGLAVSTFRRPVQVVEISPSSAVILTGTGSRLHHFNTGRAGPPIWAHPAFRRLH